MKAVRNRIIKDTATDNDINTVIENAIILLHNKGNNKDYMDALDIFKKVIDKECLYLNVKQNKIEEYAPLTQEYVVEGTEDTDPEIIKKEKQFNYFKNI